MRLGLTIGQYSLTWLYTMRFYSGEIYSPECRNKSHYRLPPWWLQLFFFKLEIQVSRSSSKLKLSQLPSHQLASTRTRRPPDQPPKYRPIQAQTKLHRSISIRYCFVRLKSLAQPWVIVVVVFVILDFECMTSLRAGSNSYFSVQSTVVWTFQCFPQIASCTMACNNK